MHHTAIINKIETRPLTVHEEIFSGKSWKGSADEKLLHLIVIIHDRHIDRDAIVVRQLQPMAITLILWH